MVDTGELSVEAGGRRLNYWVAGSDAGTVLVFQPGTPNPPVRWEALDRAARRHGFRLVSYARPGYSGSTRAQGRRVADAAPDVSVILDHLDADSFVTIGHSGGGPHAIACAALLPNRCLAAGTIGSVAPFHGYGGDWMEGMAEENIAEFEMALGGIGGLVPYLTHELEGFATADGSDFASALGDLVSASDRKAMTGEFAEMVAAAFRRASVDGLYGWVDDDLALVKPWGFELRSIEVPVTLWHGRKDRMVPIAHGEWLHDRIPGSRARFLDEDGHLSPLLGMDEILSDLAGRR